MPAWHALSDVNGVGRLRLVDPRGIGSAKQLRGDLPRFLPKKSSSQRISLSDGSGAYSSPSARTLISLFLFYAMAVPTSTSAARFTAE